MKLLKLLFNVFAIIYIYLLMPFVDLVFNLVWVIISMFNFEATGKRYLRFKKVRASYEFETEKDMFLKKSFSYKSDPLFGFFNWNWRSLWIAAAKGFLDDCDGFADLAKWMYGDGKKYSILTYGLDIETISSWHVVLVRNNKVYSSGNVYKMSFDEYLKKNYPKDKAVIRFF